MNPTPSLPSPRPQGRPESCRVVASGAEERALFIPLKREFFEAFRCGVKTNEYRIYGPRWNERTCRVGRKVVLACGYGFPRLVGVVKSFAKHEGPPPAVREAWMRCYGNRSPAVADIEIGGLTFKAKV